MITKETLKTLTEEWLQGQSGYFLVDIEMCDDDRIVIEIDHADGVWIEDCVELSRFIEDHLNRDEEDFELEVGSAGLGQPFKVHQQYENFVGKDVEVLDADGKKYKGFWKNGKQQGEGESYDPIERKWIKGFWNEGKRDVGSVLISSSSQECTNATRNFKHGIKLSLHILFYGFIKVPYYMLIC